MRLFAIERKPTTAVEDTVRFRRKKLIFALLLDQHNRLSIADRCVAVDSIARKY